MLFVVAALVLLASYGTGMAATLGGRLVPPGLRGRATAFAVGFGLLELVAFLLGRLGYYHRWSLGPIAVAFGAVGLAFVARDLLAATRSPRVGIGERRALLLAGGIVGFDALLASAPSTSGDAIAYHLVGPKLWLADGRMSEIWWDWQMSLPFATEMHFAYAQALSGGSAALVVATGLAGFSALCIYGFTAELVSRRAAAVAVLLWVGQGIFLWEATGGFVELALTGFVVLGAWHLTTFARSGNVTDAAWAGLAGGLAASVKYQGLVALVILAAAVLWLSWKQDGRRFLPTGVFLAAAGVALPWYLKNLIVLGNPVYPLLFGGKMWGPAGEAAIRQIREQYGVEGLWRLPILPIEVLRDPARFDRIYTIGPALVGLLPLALVWRRSWVWPLAAGIGLYVVVWFEFMDQVDRYLLPALGVGAALAAHAWMRLWQGGRTLRGVAVASAVGAAVPFVLMTGAFASQALPGALHLQSRERFVQRMTGTYSAFEWLDRNLPPPGRVLVGMRNLYWLDRPYARYSPPLFGDEEPLSAVEARMHAYEIRYLAFPQDAVPAHVRRLRPRLRPIARLSMPYVTSRTLRRTEQRWLLVWEWCDARVSHPARSPCRMERP